MTNEQTPTIRCNIVCDKEFIKALEKELFCHCGSRGRSNEVADWDSGRVSELLRDVQQLDAELPEYDLHIQSDSKLANILRAAQRVCASAKSVRAKGWGTEMPF